jgi:hypothetical protein
MDGDTLKRAHNLFIHTRHRDPADSPADYTVEIPAGYIRVRDPARERLRISLASFCGWWNWTEVDGGRNALRLTNLQSGAVTAVTIPPGNYAFARLARLVSAACPACVCTYTLETNRFAFDFGAVPHRLEFPDRAHEVFGFPAGGAEEGTRLTSSLPVRPMQRVNIYVRLLDVAMCSDEHLNLDNFGGPHMEPSNILCSFPIDGAPWQTLRFSDVAAGRELGMWIGDTNLTKLRYQLTDADGRVLDFLDDYEATFQVGVYEKSVGGGDLALSAIQRTLGGMATTLSKVAMLLYSGGVPGGSSSPLGPPL